MPFATPTRTTVSLELVTPFSRYKTPDQFSYSEMSESEITGSALARHAIRAITKTKKDGEKALYILKHLTSSAAAKEAYSAWIFRLHVLDGSRIPKYARLGLDSAVVSQKISGVETLLDLYNSNICSDGGLNSAEFVRKFVEKLQSPGLDNLRAFSQILVCTIVFAEDDLKGGHLLFDGDGRLNRYDFDLCFFDGLDFNVDDFENLPLVSSFKPYNLIFNYVEDDVDLEGRDMGFEVAAQLGPQFKAYVYEAVLKILLMPDFLLNEISGVLEPYKEKISEERVELAPQKKAKLFACMLRSEGFKGFLGVYGEEAKERILSEISAFQVHNSHFRKKWSAENFRDQCEESVNAAYSELKTNLGFQRRGEERRISLEGNGAGVMPRNAEEQNQNPDINLKNFITTQIARLSSCHFTLGVKDKIVLLEKILGKLEGVDSRLKRQLESETAIVMRHRRIRSSHMFTNSSSVGWREWETYCRQNNLVIQKRPSLQLDDGQEISSYSAYRSRFNA